jgi:hypothetical protein
MKKNHSIVGVSKDNKYVFTNKGFYVCENEGFYVPYDDSMLPYLIQIAKDNNDFEFKSGIISINEYLSKPRKILTIISEVFSPQTSLQLIKEWENKFGKKTIISESINRKTSVEIVNEAFNGLRVLVSEQNIDATALDITTKLINSLSKFNDDEEEALKQIKRINSKELLDKINQQLKNKKNMDIKTYINDEMSDIDWEYKAIFDHLKTIDSSLYSGYKSSKVLRATGKVVDAAVKVGGFVLKGLSEAAKKIILPILKKGIIPLMRWIRRNAYTTIGIVVDVVTALIPYTTGINKIIWGLIVLLGLYEIITGDIDPQDPDRVSNPYMFLIIDIISFLFTAVMGQTAKAGLKMASKGMSSTTSKLLKSLLNKLPSLRNGLKGISNTISKYLPGLYKILESVFRGIDKIILGVETFIRQLFSKKGAVAVGMGVSIAWFFKERNLKVGDTGNDINAVNKYFSENHNNNFPECPISQNLINSIKNDGNQFTKNTEDAVKTFEGCLVNKGGHFKDFIKSVDGQITNAELALYTNVEMDDRGYITRFIPHSTKEAFQKTFSSILTSSAKGLESIIPKGGEKPKNTTTNQSVNNKEIKSDNEMSDLAKELDLSLQS